jgi:hypothetical protein
VRECRREVYCKGVLRVGFRSNNPEKSKNKKEDPHDQTADRTDLGDEKEIKQRPFGVPVPLKSTVSSVHLESQGHGRSFTFLSESRIRPCLYVTVTVWVLQNDGLRKTNITIGGRITCVLQEMP